MGQVFRGLAVSGRRAEALAILDKLGGLEKDENRQPIVPVATASVYAFLDRHDDAFRWLEIGYADHFPLLFELRGDPRFADLVRGIGL